MTLILQLFFLSALHFSNLICQARNLISIVALGSSSSKLLSALSIDTYLVSENIPFSTKTLLVLLMSAFFAENQRFFGQK